MVLCMIPVSFAASVTGRETISDKSYDITVFSWDKNDFGKELGSATNANSVTANFNYETENDDITSMFEEDAKMAIVRIVGFDDQDRLENADDIEVRIDGKKLEVNELAGYYPGAVGYMPKWNAVYFPIQLTKAGYQDSYLIEVSGTYESTTTDGGKVETTYTETAKISVKMVNDAEYKNAKTATISKIESNARNMDAYIVGSKIYLDFTPEGEDYSGWYGQTVDITFKDNNGDLFDVVTWAYQVDNDKGMVMSPVGGTTVGNKIGKKLDDSTMTYSIHSAVDDSPIQFTLETSSSIYETKEFDVVKRFGIVEADPKGIYFAENSKTIAIGEEYTPVVLGVATGKKVDATIEIGTRTSDGEAVNAQYVDVTDGETVIGTQEGVAYITASYTTNDDKTYTASSMKITVTAKGATDDDDDTDGKTYMVTASSLRVRSGAGTNFSQIGSLKNGATVKVESIANGWAKLENGGYVSAQYLAEVVDNGEAQTMYVTARTLNVRKGPGTSYAKAGTLSRGTAVQVVGFSGNWAKLSNGYYVSTSYLAK